MNEPIIHNYKFGYDTNGYIISFTTVDDDKYDFTGQMSQYPEATHGWTKFIDGQFVEDEAKKAEILAEDKRKAEEPT